jgi:hypothetical protein
VVGKKPSTLESLSTQLDVGINAIWGFRKKVVERITELSEYGNEITAAKWQDVILDSVHKSPKSKTRTTKAENVSE